MPKRDSTATETTEQSILRVATELFYEQGFHATTMRDIAARVGIKAGSLYNHFPGKEDILLRIALATTRQLYEGAVARLEGVEDLDERLRAFVRWHVEFHAAHREASRVADGQLHALSAENRAAVVEVRDAHEQLLKEMLRAGVADGRWAIANESVMAIGLLTMYTEVDGWFRGDGPLTAEQVGAVFADFTLRGLTTPDT